jgi:DnaJ-class molecular chaperone
MPNYEIRISTAGSSLQKSPKPINYCTWKCPFCQGKGLDPYAKAGGDRCPACRGKMLWEADIDFAMLSTCGRCAGTGRINYMGNWAPCSTCKGSGKV